MPLKNALLLLVSFFSATTLFSQNETSKWYFGHYAAVDFLNNPPSAISTCALDAVEGTASIADATGNLLFYTHGYTIWNKNDQPMSNGTNLIGNPSSTQSSLIVRKPGSSNLYYVFTTGQSGISPLAYSVVDMSLAAGLGSVTVKNETLAAQMTEKLAGTLHCNGTDVWIVAHKYLSNAYYAYLLSATGVNTVAVVSAIGTPHGPALAAFGGPYAGNLKIAPTGKKIGVAVYDDQSSFFELADFNPSTGTVSNPLNLGTFPYAYACEFSPDGTKFYSTTVPSGGNGIINLLLQWNLCAGSATAIVNSKTTVLGNLPAYSLSSMQLGAAGKIYVGVFGENYLGQIDNPNSLAPTSNFLNATIPLSAGAVCNDGLANFLGSFFREKASFSTASTCGTSVFSYTAPSYCSGVSYSVNAVHWDFGDISTAFTNTSSAPNPSHTYAANGTYTVKLTVTYDCNADVITKIITISDLPNLALTGKLTLCKNETTKLTAAGATSYSWSTGATSSTLALSPTLTTTYTLTGNNSMCAKNKIFTLTVLPCTSLEENNSTLNTVILYPNPASDKLFVETLTAGYLELCNALGQLVRVEKITAGKTEINILSLPKGIYSVKAFCGEPVTRIKFIKE